MRAAWQGVRIGVAVVAVWTAAALGGGVAPAAAAPSPIGAHSMLQLDDPPSFMATMFSEAAAMGASTIRLDIAPALVFRQPLLPADFSGLDEVMALAARYHLRVVGDLMTVPDWLADCPTPEPPDAERCATNDLGAYGSVIGQIVAHADPVIHDWEIWNEPDSGDFFHGTPEQYARMLRAAHDAITAVDPRAHVLLGGISGTAGKAWLARVLSVPGADAAHAFDIANVHERGRLDALADAISGWRRFFADHGFTGPLWVTEHGYPSDPTFQSDPAYASGAPAQAAYLTASVPTLLDAGAAEVLVTERDNLGGPFASEGIIGGTVADPPPSDPQVIEKPAFGAMRTLIGCYEELDHDCPAAAPAARPAAAVLPVTGVGAASQVTVTVSDPGTEPLALGAAVLLDPSPGPSPLTLEQDGCAGLILEPDETCTARVRFAPATFGSRTVTLRLTSDQGTLDVPVSATSPSVSSLRVSPRLRAGGAGAGPEQMILTVFNPLSGPVRVSSARVSGRRLVIISDRCRRARLAPRTSCTVTVLWRPRAPGTGRATVILHGDGRALIVRLRPRAPATGHGSPGVRSFRAPRGPRTVPGPR